MAGAPGEYSSIRSENIVTVRDGIDDGLEDCRQVVLRPVDPPQVLGCLDPLIPRHEPAGVLDLIVEGSVAVLGVELVARRAHRVGNADAAVRHRLDERLRQPALRLARPEKQPGHGRAEHAGRVLPDHVELRERGRPVVAAALPAKPVHQTRIQIVQRRVLDHLNLELPATASAALLEQPRENGSLHHAPRRPGTLQVPARTPMHEEPPRNLDPEHRPHPAAGIRQLQLLDQRHDRRRDGIVGDLDHVPLHRVEVLQRDPGHRARRVGHAQPQDAAQRIGERRQLVRQGIPTRPLDSAARQDHLRECQRAIPTELDLPDALGPVRHCVPPARTSP